jgi:hypothetical protein|nr:MAG TPA: hypothetical protein [Caudoviricetes sp.]
MKQTLEEAAIAFANKCHTANIKGGLDYPYDELDMRNAFEAGAEWQAKQLSCVSVYEKLLESNKDDFLSHHIDKVKMRIIRIVASDAHAVTFQTLGQYRGWLMKAINELDYPIPEL